MTTRLDEIRTAAEAGDGPLLLSLLAEHVQSDDRDSDVVRDVVAAHVELLLVSGSPEEVGPFVAEHLGDDDAPVAALGTSPHVEEAFELAGRIANIPHPSHRQLRDAQERVADILDRAPLHAGDVDAFRRIWSATDPGFASDRLLAHAERLTSLDDDPTFYAAICAGRFQRWDFAGTVSSGQRALTASGASKGQRTVLHRMVGVAAAFLGDEETARIHAGHLRTLRASALEISDVLGVLALQTQGPARAVQEFDRGGSWDSVGDDVLHSLAHSGRDIPPAHVLRGTAVSLAAPVTFFRGLLTHGPAHIVDLGLFVWEVAERTGLYLCGAAIIASLLDDDLATRPSDWPKAHYESAVESATGLLAELLRDGGAHEAADARGSVSDAQGHGGPPSGIARTARPGFVPVQERALAPTLAAPDVVRDFDDAATLEALLLRDFDTWFRSASKLLRAEPEASTWDEVGRNDPCPCGSGAKFKRCHG